MLAAAARHAGAATLWDALGPSVVGGAAGGTGGAGGAEPGGTAG
eukprot:gene6584-4285_t